jgi:Caspase domain
LTGQRSWASIHANGRYEASLGDAISLRFEDKASREVVTLGHFPEPLTFGEVSATRLPDGPVRVRTTAFSSHGPPRVRLDDRWDIASVRPSPTSLTAYEVDFLLDELAETSHRLDASAEGGEPAHVAFTPPPAVRNGPKHPRALLVGNGAYSGDPTVPPLVGSLKDADDLWRALGGQESWALDADHLDIRKNLKAREMEDAIRRFFHDAVPDETLLFYYAGHGDSEGGEGYLLPTDYKKSEPYRRLSASTLWGFIEASKASQIVVILDACRAGAFLLPDAVVRKARDKRVMFLTSTSHGGAKDTSRGGPFTQALVEALGRQESVDPHHHAVTVYKAFLHAADVAGQGARLVGSEKLDSVALAWPRLPGARSVTTPVQVDAAGVGSALADVDASVVADRQIQAHGEEVGTKVEVRVLFAEDTDWLRIGVYYPETATEAPSPEAFYPNTSGPQWRKGQRVTIPVPLDGLDHGTYRIWVEPCEAGKVCGKQAAAKFTVKL